MVRSSGVSQILRSEVRFGPWRQFAVRAALNLATSLALAAYIAFGGGDFFVAGLVLATTLTLATGAAIMVWLESLSKPSAPVDRTLTESTSEIARADDAP